MARAQTKVCVAIAAALFACHSQRPAARPEAAYADSRQCAGCHSAIYQSYRRTGMAQALYRPRPENTPAATFFHKTSETHYAMLQRALGSSISGDGRLDIGGKKENAEELQYRLIT